MSRKHSKDVKKTLRGCQENTQRMSRKHRGCSKGISLKQSEDIFEATKSKAMPTDAQLFSYGKVIKYLNAYF